MKKSKILLSFLTPMTLGAILTPVALTLTACSESVPIAPATFYRNSSTDNTYWNQTWVNPKYYYVSSAEEMEQLFTSGEYPDNMIKWDIIYIFCWNYTGSWVAEFTHFERNGKSLKYEITITPNDSPEEKHVVFTTKYDLWEAEFDWVDITDFSPSPITSTSSWKTHLSDYNASYSGGWSQFIVQK